MPLPPCDLTVLKDWLWDEDQIEVLMVGWGGGHYIRVSTQCYARPIWIERTRPYVSVQPHVCAAE